MSEGGAAAWGKTAMNGVAVVATTVCSVGVTAIWQSFDGLVKGVQQIAVQQAVVESQVRDVKSALVGVYLKREADAQHAIIYRTNQDQYRRIVVLEKDVSELKAASARWAPAEWVKGP